MHNEMQVIAGPEHERIQIVVVDAEAGSNPLPHFANAVVNRSRENTKHVELLPQRVGTRVEGHVDIDRGGRAELNNVGTAEVDWLRFSG